MKECYSCLEKKIQLSFSPLSPDAQMIFQASLANAQILIPSSQAGVSTMLLEGRTLLALATTMYAPGGVDLVCLGFLQASAGCNGRPLVVWGRT